MKTVYISYQSIKDLHPCADQLRVVRKLFGKRKRMAVTIGRAVALSSQFDFNWLAQGTLTGSALQAYNAARAQARQAGQAYDAATAQAGQAYDAATAQARQACDAARAQARQAGQAYDAATASAWQAYSAATAQARQACDAATARAWAQQYIKQQTMKG